MANVVDALIVTLGLDQSGFEKGQKEASASMKKTGEESTKRMKEMEANAKRAAEGFLTIKREVLSLATALVTSAGIKAFAEHIINSDMAIGKLSKNLGVSTERLSAFGNAAEEFGESKDTMNDAFRTVVKIAEEYKNLGGSSATQWLARLNIDLGKFSSQSTTADQRIQMLADALKKASPQDAQFFGQQIGLSEGAINVLMRGNSVLEETVNKYEKLNAVHQKSIDTEAKLKQKFTELSSALEGVGRKFLDENAPMIEAALKAMTDHAEATAIAIGTITLGVGALSAKILAKGLGKMFGLGGAPAAEATDAVASPGAAAGAASRLSPWWGAGGAGIAAMLYSSDLNSNEDAELKKNRGQFGFPGARAIPQGGKSSSELFAALEKQYGLPAGLLDSVWNTESGRGKHMKSKAGALGHFQFMPATAKSYGLKDPNNLEESADAAAHMYADLLRKYHGDIKKAIAAYNWGSGHVDRLGMGKMPAETRKYLAKVGAGMGLRDGNSGNISSTEVNIAQINIQTQATDANSMAKDVGPTLRNVAFASQAATGVN